MRKLIVVLTILVFLACMIMGLYASNILPGSDKSNQGEAVSKPPGASYQRNIAIIHIDDLQASSPKLISIWGLILYFPEPKVILQPLYPLDVQGNQDLAGRFSLTANGEPNQVFMKFLAEDNQITWDNYLLVDQKGLSAIGMWAFGGDPLQVNDPSLSFLQLEKVYFNQLCGSLEAQGSQFLVGSSWTDIIPDHMHSNIGLDDWLADWARLTKGTGSLDCQVFGQ
jgi:hypothetical protein